MCQSRILLSSYVFTVTKKLLLNSRSDDLFFVSHVKNFFIILQYIHLKLLLVNVILFKFFKFCNQIILWQPIIIMHHMAKLKLELVKKKSKIMENSI